MVTMKTHLYPSFVAWVEAEVRSKEGVIDRLDGRSSGGTREVFGRFEHGGKKWEVHGDTRIAKIMDAYRGISSSLEDPFVIEQTETRECLNLAPQLRMPGARKYFYVYKSK